MANAWEVAATVGVVGLITWLGKMWIKSEFEALNRRLQAEFDKRVFISRTHFETEFQALADIWKKVAEVRATMAIPLRAPNKSDKDHQAFEAASKAVGELVVAIDTQSPFYSKEIYSELDQLRKLAIIELSYVSDAGADHVSSRHSMSEFWPKLRDGSDRISDAIRDRLERLSSFE